MHFNHTAKLFALALLAGVSSAAAAEEPVELRAVNGSISVKGTLIGYDDTTYVIKTKLGKINVKRDRVDCFGTSCPPVQEARSTPSTILN